MTFLLTILVGLYIVADSVFLASHSEGEHRFCMLARYAGAFMSGFYLIFTNHCEQSLLLGLTIALFMWPDTFFRLVEYLRINHPSFHQEYIERLKNKPRRRTDFETYT